MDFNQLVTDQLKAINVKLDHITERMAALERDADRGKSQDAVLVSQNESILKMLNGHETRIKAIEDSPAMKFNSVYRAFIDKLILIVTGGAAVWIVTKLLPSLISK